MSAIARHRNSTSISNGGSRKRRERPSPIGSSLLSDDENRQLFEIMGKDRISFAAGVAQLLASCPEKPNIWSKVNLGVAILVKDYRNKFYQLCMYDIFKKDPLWTQTLYKNFSAHYYVNCPRFITFESDSCVNALNFADFDEAERFKIALNKRRDHEKKLTQREQRTGNVDLQQNQPPLTYQAQTEHRFINDKNSYQNGSDVQHFAGITNIGAVPHFGGNISRSNNAKKENAKRNAKKKRKDPIKKEDIGNPTNFQHKMHVGWNACEGFNYNTSDEQPMEGSFRELLSKIGINPDKMDSDEAEYARKFYNENVDKYQEVEECVVRSPQQRTMPLPISPPTAPPVQFTTPQQIFTRQQPPPRPPPLNNPHCSINDTRPYHQPVIVAHHPGLQTGPPPPPRVVGASLGGELHQSSVQPPPLPAMVAREKPPPPPIPPTIHQENKQIQPVIPPPPPPLPPSQLKPKLTENPTASTTSSLEAPLPTIDQGRANLLQQIQQGTKLKKVEPPSQDKVPIPTNPPTLRDNMMEQIKQGTTLKHIDQNYADSNRRSGGLQEMGGIAGALARALEERRRNIRHSDGSSDSDDQTNNDSDWGDEQE